MKSAINTKRKTDAVISIKQDNDARKIFITNMNPAAESLTGYNSREIIGRNFNTMLPARINELLDGYLEFGVASSDFAMVARRIPNFQVLSKQGEIITVSLKIFNLVSQGTNIQEYELLLRDVTLIKKIAELKEIIISSENTITEKDPHTGLPSINSVVYALDAAYAFLKEYNAIEACFVMLEVSNIAYYSETYGEYIAYEIIGTLGGLVKKCCRNEDVVGYMGDGVIAVVLIDCNLESAKIVINRIKNKVDTTKITIQNGQQITLSLNLSYTQIRKGIEMFVMIDTCESGLDSLASRGGDGVVQV